MGRHPLASGRLFVEGKPVRERDIGGKSPAGSRSSPRIANVTGSFQFCSVAENLTMASLRKLTRGFHIQARAEADEVRREIKELSIKVTNPRLPVSSLSGGKSAEGRDRQGAAHFSQGPAYGRTKPGNRHWSQSGCLPHHAWSRGAGARNRLRHVRPRRSPRAVRPNSGDEQRPSYCAAGSRGRNGSQNRRGVVDRSRT